MKEDVILYERVENILLGNDAQYNRLPRPYKIVYLRNVRDYVVSYQKGNVATVQERVPTVQKQKIYTNQNRVFDNKAA